MVLPLYLAMTGREILAAQPSASRCAYMACHFSPYGLGLSNLPKALPEGAVILLSDRIPPGGHDAEVVVAQLEELVRQFQPKAIVLDLETAGNGFCRELAVKCSGISGAEITVAAAYAKDLPCSVFVGAGALWTPAEKLLKPWQGRKLWVEAVLQRGLVTVTDQGAGYEELPWEPPEEELPVDEDLQVAYRIRQTKDAVEVMLWRGKEQLPKWMEKLEQLGAEGFLGLYQQLR